MSKPKQPTLHVEVHAVMTLVSRVPDRRYKLGYREQQIVGTAQQMLPARPSNYDGRDAIEMFQVNLQTVYKTPRGVYRGATAVTTVGRGNTVLNSWEMG